MSYNFEVYLSDDAGGLDVWVEVLRKSNKDAQVETDDNIATLTIGTWTLRCSLYAADTVNIEAREIAESAPDRIKEGLANCKKRLEIECNPESETDDHYNTWLAVQDNFAAQSGMFVFIPFDGSFL